MNTLLNEMTVGAIDELRGDILSRRPSLSEEEATMVACAVWNCLIEEGGKHLDDHLDSVLKATYCNGRLTHRNDGVELVVAFHHWFVGLVLLPQGDFGDYVRARHLFEKSLSLCPDFWPAHTCSAYASIAIGAFMQAKEHAEKAIELSREWLPPNGSKVAWTALVKATRMEQVLGPFPSLKRADAVFSRVDRRTCADIFHEVQSMQDAMERRLR